MLLNSLCPRLLSLLDIGIISEICIYHIMNSRLRASGNLFVEINAVCPRISAINNVFTKLVYFFSRGYCVASVLL